MGTQTPRRICTVRIYYNKEWWNLEGIWDNYALIYQLICMHFRTTRNWGIAFFVLAGIVIVSGLALLCHVWMKLKNQSGTTNQTRIEIMPGVVYEVRRFR